ncbi:Ig-like domain-containing protein [Ramlibacter sp. AN1133]|uniref:Ig-like domain-containing protein n=1 Tax=Ramlibacter sp. AN1133 TaxID=3133429 RepID=UPI0030BE3E61
MKQKRNLIAAAVLLTMATAPAWAVLERMGPINNAPSVGGYPAWFQDKTGVAIEFCDPQSQAELDGGWCLLLPGDVNFPEAFPANFFDEHFYWAAGNTLLDPGTGLKANLVLALEAAFANGPAVAGDQMTFGRMRVFIPRLPFDGDYRVVTPYSDVTYFDQPLGGRIFDTLDIGVACIGTFECTLNAPIGPFLLPSPQAGGAEVPPMPDLAAAAPGTDPFYDQMVALGAGPTASPGTGKKYIADPARVGPVTGSPMADFTAFNTDGTSTLRNHNTFRIEVRPSTPTRDAPVFYTVDGETNFVLMGRLMTGSLPGAVSGGRAVYTADATGTVTKVDVFAKASPTTQARVPAQPQQAAVQPLLAFYDQPCGGAVTIDPVTGATIVSAGPYTAPAGVAHDMAHTDTDYWGQSQPGGLPASHVCIVDQTAKNAAGQVVPAYYLRKLTDEVTINTALFDGANNGTLSVTAVSSDPTSQLTLGGYGPAGATAGTSVGKGAGTGLDLAAGSASVSGLQAPPSAVQIVSSKGGSSMRNTDTSAGTAVLLGVPNTVADNATMNEDCSATSAAACPAGQGVTIDLLANDTILMNGTLTTLRNVVAGGLGTVVVTAQPARLGTATVSADGILTYTPNANANGTDSITYSVSVNGTASNQSQATINITPVNDVPVAGNVAAGAVVGKLNMLNALATSTDPDGNGDVKDAVILTWPAQLGAQPTPLNGILSYTPTASGAFSFTYQVTDVAGALSANTATGTVTVALNEVITFGKHQFVQNKNRWTIDGTDNIVQGQTITVVYEDGWLVGAPAACNGTATNANCVIGTSPVDGLGNFLLDKVGVSGALNPKAGTSIWKTAPTRIRAYSTLPSLGGTAAIDIVFK